MASDFYYYPRRDALPPAILEDRRRLSREAIDEILGMMQPTPYRFLAQMIGAWLVIGATIAVAEHAQSIPVMILAIYIIGTRQNILGLLVHEQCHSLAFKSTVGTSFANLCAAYPLLISVENYRGVHLAHHRHFFTDRDPDYRRKQGNEWSFPQQGRKLLRTILTDATGVNALSIVKSKRAARNLDLANGTGTPRLRAAYYVILAAFLTIAHLWTFYLLYWIVPLLTIMQVIVRWGAICEHKYDLVAPSIVESTPIIQLKWWERVLLPNLNFTYHIYHHYYPGIPYDKLPRIHDIYREEGLVNERNVFHGYCAYLKFLLAIDPQGFEKDVARQEGARDHS